MRGFLVGETARGRDLDGPADHIQVVLRVGVLECGPCPGGLGERVNVPAQAAAERGDKLTLRTPVLSQSQSQDDVRADLARVG